VIDLEIWRNLGHLMAKTIPPKVRDFMAFRPEKELAEAMARLEKRDGISTSEMLRRGVKLYLKQKGIAVKEEK